MVLKLVDEYTIYFKITTLTTNIPVLKVEPKNRDIFLPVELCTIVEGQRCIRFRLYYSFKLSTQVVETFLLKFCA